MCLNKNLNIKPFIVDLSVEIYHIILAITKVSAPYIVKAVKEGVRGKGGQNSLQVSADMPHHFLLVLA